MEVSSLCGPIWLQCNQCGKFNVGGSVPGQLRPSMPDVVALTKTLWIIPGFAKHPPHPTTLVLEPCNVHQESVSLGLMQCPRYHV